MSSHFKVHFINVIRSSLSNIFQHNSITHLNISLIDSIKHVNTDLIEYTSAYTVIEIADQPVSKSLVIFQCGSTTIGVCDCKHCERVYDQDICQPMSTSSINLKLLQVAAVFCILVQKSEEIEESRALDNSDECNGECQYATFKIIFALVSSSELRRLVKAEFENVNTQI